MLRSPCRSRRIRSRFPTNAKAAPDERGIHDVTRFVITVLFEPLIFNCIHLNCILSLDNDLQAWVPVLKSMSTVW